MCRQCQGLGEQSPLNERQGLWSGREGVVEVPVVLFGDFEARHSLGKSNKQGNRIDGFSGVIYTGLGRKFQPRFVFSVAGRMVLSRICPTFCSWMQSGDRKC